MNSRNMGVVILLSLFLVGCFSIHFTESSIFSVVPPPDSIQPPATLSPHHHFQSVTFTTRDGYQLEGWWFSLSDTLPTLLFCGGDAFTLQSSESWMRILAPSPVNVFAFNYRGYGHSTGHPTLAGIVKDGEAASAFLQDSLGVPTSALFLLGHSLGSYVTVQLARHQPVAGLIVDAPITDVPDLYAHIRHQFPWWWRVIGSMQIDSSVYALNNMPDLPHLACPTFVIARERDTVVPVSSARRFYAALPPDQRHWMVVPDATHNHLPAAAVGKYVQTILHFMRAQ